jgi:hypothetical protein
LITHDREIRALKAKAGKQKAAELPGGANRNEKPARVNRIMPKV